MGGSYPCGREYNFFGYNSTAAAHVVNKWPGAVTFSGDELGRNVWSGARLMVEGPVGDPVRAAYEWYKYVQLIKFGLNNINKDAVAITGHEIRGIRSRCCMPSKVWEIYFGLEMKVGVITYIRMVETLGD